MYFDLKFFRLPVRIIKVSDNRGLTVIISVEPEMFSVVKVLATVSLVERSIIILCPYFKGCGHNQSFTTMHSIHELNCTCDSDDPVPEFIVHWVFSFLVIETGCNSHILIKAEILQLFQEEVLVRDREGNLTNKLLGYLDYPTSEI